MKLPLKLDFTDFWHPFDKTDNFFFNLLGEHYEIELTSQMFSGSSGASSRRARRKS